MTTIDSVRTASPTSKPVLLRLLRSERLKMTSTKTWWLFGIGVLVGSGLWLTASILSLASDLDNEIGAHVDNGPAQTAASIAATHAPAVFTSGQYISGLFVMLLSILLITNEYHHQTVTSTFLATPRRTTVVAAKFVMAIIMAVVVWVVVTAMNVIVGLLFYNSRGLDSGIGSSAVLRAIAVNLLMYALWAVFGIGLGALLRSQIGATVTSALLYTIGIYGAFAVIALIHQFIFRHDVVWKAVVLIPAIAAQIAETPNDTSLPGNVEVHWWVGVVVMLAYGVVMTVVGTSILRKRDIS
jgi:ABC-2 type transport system permease protein